jgi:hypothetical protein
MRIWLFLKLFRAEFAFFIYFSPGKPESFPSFHDCLIGSRSGIVKNLNTHLYDFGKVEHGNISSHLLPEIPSSIPFSPASSDPA